MKSRFSKGQSTKRALKRRNKVMVADKSSANGLRIAKVPSKFKESFIEVNKKRLLKFVDEQKIIAANKKVEANQLVEAINQ